MSANAAVEETQAAHTEWTVDSHWNCTRLQEQLQRRCQLSEADFHLVRSSLVVAPLQELLAVVELADTASS